MKKMLFFAWVVLCAACVVMVSSGYDDHPTVPVVNEVIGTA